MVACARWVGWRRVITATLSVAAAVAAPYVAGADRLPLAGSHLYYEVHGTGRPLVLIHGGNLDAGMWDDDVPVLAKTFRVITYDVRPYGRSGPATPDYAWHEDLRALLDHLKIERADLVGLSLGARLAINFALAYPSRVDRLVLAGPGRRRVAVRARSAAPRPDRGRQGPRCQPGDRAVAPASLHGAGDARSGGGDASCGNSPRATSTSGCSRLGPAVVPSPPALTRLSEIRAPTLVLVGTLDVADIQGTAEAAGARTSAGRASRCSTASAT